MTSNAAIYNGYSIDGDPNNVEYIVFNVKNEDDETGAGVMIEKTEIPDLLRDLVRLAVIEVLIIPKPEVDSKRLLDVAANPAVSDRTMLSYGGFSYNERLPIDQVHRLIWDLAAAAVDASTYANRAMVKDLEEELSRACLGEASVIARAVIDLGYRKAPGETIQQGPAAFNRLLSS